MKTNITYSCILICGMAFSMSFSSFAIPSGENAKTDDAKSSKIIVADGISYQIIDSENRYVKVVQNETGSYQGAITIPEEIDIDGERYTVTGIGKKAFYGDLTAQSDVKVTLPNSITMIEDSAFYSIKATACNIPENLEYIGHSAFCLSQLPEGLETLPETVGYIGCSAFAGCNLSNLRTLPSRIESIEDFTFSQARIGNLNLGENIVSIKRNAFNSSGIKSISLPSGLEQVGDSAFLGCYALEAITVSPDNNNFSAKDGVLLNKDLTRLIVYPSGKSSDTYTVPDGVKEIGDCAFYDNQLKNISLPESLETIGDHAFQDNDGIESMDIPSGVHHIGDGAFMMCDNLKTVQLPDIGRISDMLFRGCSVLDTIDIPSTVKTIGNSAFSMTSLANVVVPEGVVSIMDFAFASSKVKSVILPATLEHLGVNAFNFCLYLESVCCKAMTPPEAVSSFDYPLGDNVVLYVPKGSKEQYMSAPVWKDFSNIVEGVLSSVHETVHPQATFNTTGDGITITGHGTLVTISTLSGSVLYHAKVNGSETINLARGIYLLKMDSCAQKIMIE